MSSHNTAYRKTPGSTLKSGITNFNLIVVLIAALPVCYELMLAIDIPRIFAPGLLFLWILFFDLLLINNVRKKLDVLIGQKRAYTGRTFVTRVYSILSVVLGVVYIGFLILMKLKGPDNFLFISGISGETVRQGIFLVFLLFMFRIFFVQVGVLMNFNIKNSINRISLVSGLLTLIIFYQIAFPLFDLKGYSILIFYIIPVILLFFSLSILFRHSIKKIDPYIQR